MSKRKLLQLVNEAHVAGWDDPRMPTLAGMRRRGYTPEAIRTFCERIGVGKRENLVDLALLEFCVREDLNYRAPRVMGVLRPLKVVLVNYPEDRVEELEAVNNPEDPEPGHPEGAVLPGVVYRAGGLHGRPAQEVLPPGPGAGGPAALRLLHQVRSSGQGPLNRRGGGTALHL